jgi:hypothetical protein
MLDGENQIDDVIDGGLTDDADGGSVSHDESRDDRGRDGKPERLSVRDQIEKAWKEHGGELPESRREPRKRPTRSELQPRKDKNSDRDATLQGAPVKPDPTSDGGAAPAATSPPGGWSTDAKADWSKLPPHVQAAITKRETDMSAGAKQLQERYGGIHRLVTGQLAAPAQKYGLTPDRILENAVSWFNEIERNPLDGLRKLAQLYRINGATASAASPSGQPNANPGQASSGQISDPRIDTLIRVVTDMQNSQYTDAKQAELKAWSANKPHFESVRQVMAQIIAGAERLQDTSILDATGAAVDLDKVYERATWQVPEVRAAVLKEQATARRNAQTAQATQAGRAGVSVKPGTPGSGQRGDGGTKPLPKGSPVRDHIKAAMAELRST